MIIGHDGAEIRNGIGKEKNISFIDETSAQDEPTTFSEIEESTDEAKIYAAEMIKNRQPYKCALLKPAKASEAKMHVAAYTYSFNVRKTDLIVYRFLKDGRIKLQKNQIIPHEEELRKRKYYKSHNSWSHRTNECMAFKRQIQKEINECQLVFADQENKNNMKNCLEPIFFSGQHGRHKKKKAPIKRKIEQDIASTKSALRLCIRCKAEMTRRN